MVAAGITPAASETGDPLLLTPGPLTTSRSVKQAMLHDWGSRDAAFVQINREVMERLPAIVGAAATHVTVPMQGSGTFAVEAMLTTFVPPNGEVLLLVNGAYGHRARRILEIARRRVVVHETPEDTPPDIAAVERILAATASITHVFAVHCETTSGILNPVQEIGALAAKHRKALPDRTRCLPSAPCRSMRMPLMRMRSPPRRTSASRASRASAS